MYTIHILFDYGNNCIIFIKQVRNLLLTIRQYRFNYKMSISYNQISEEIGYTGYMPYPSLDTVRDLFQVLCNNPTISDFKNALKLYRFTPEAKTPDQTEIIRLTQAGLAIAMNRLYLTQSKKSTGDIVREYIHKLIPA